MADHSLVTQQIDSAWFLLRSSRQGHLVDRVLTETWCLNSHSLVTLGKRPCKVIVQVSQETELFELVELNLEDVLEMAGQLVTIGGRH